MKKVNDFFKRCQTFFLISWQLLQVYLRNFKHSITNNLHFSSGTRKQDSKILNIIMLKSLECSLSICVGFWNLNQVLKNHISLGMDSIPSPWGEGDLLWPSIRLFRDNFNKTSITFKNWIGIEFTPRDVFGAQSLVIIKSEIISSDSSEESVADLLFSMIPLLEVSLYYELLVTYRFSPSITRIFEWKQFWFSDEIRVVIHCSLSAHITACLSCISLDSHCYYRCNWIGL